jgi:predicted metal-dependent peptidase
MNPIDRIIIKYLISTSVPGKVFYASLLTQMYKQESKLTPTMGVTVSDGQLYLLYNKKFVDLMIEKEGLDSLKGIIEHEVLHIVHDHLSRAKEFNRIPEIYNWATDMAINQTIDKKIMPKKVWGFDKHNEPKEGQLMWPSQFNLPEDKDSEWYYTALMKNAKKVGGKGKKKGQGQQQQGKGDGQNDPQEGDGQGTLDDHELWKKIKDSKQSIREVSKKAVKDAYENTKKLRGTLPHDLEQAIQDLLKPPTISWRQILKRYVGASIRTGFKSSWKRPNRRFPTSEEFKGKVANRTIKILLAVDTSGSVSDKDFQDFIAEMKGILNVYKCNIDILQCDADLHGLIQLKPYTKVNIKFKGRGGTDYKPVFDWLYKHQEYDLLIYFTDLYCDFVGCKTTKNVIWVCTPDGDDKNVPPFGRLVKIKKDYERCNSY